MKSFAPTSSRAHFSVPSFAHNIGTIPGCRIATAFRGVVIVSILVSMSVIAAAQNPPRDLTTVSIDDLMNIQVFSASKKDEKLFRSATAIYVITAEDIRRSGLTSVPELLRMVPGLDVARLNGSVWAISARGFNTRLSNKLLVMIDGRSVSSATFAGVYWNAQDLLLEDVERIEVIRGPGTTLWGTNSVNGVISIITKHAKDTQGGLITAGGGSEERGFGGIRYGGKLRDKTYYRIYGKYSNRNGLVDAHGLRTPDQWSMLQGGGRVDFELSPRDQLTVQGDIYNSDTHEIDMAISPAAPFAPHVTSANDFVGGNLVAHWKHAFSTGSDIEMRFYYNRARRTAPVVGQESSNIFDFDFQHRFTIGRRQEIVWGTGYRHTSSDSISDTTTPVRFDPRGVGAPLFSAFVQDEITLKPDRLRLTVGSKFEDTNYAGFELQPSVRLLWTPRANQAFWGAISRAVRTTLHDDKNIRVNLTGIRFPDGTPAVLALVGNRDARSETLLAYELGYRVEPLKQLSFDIAAFYNVYDRLATREPQKPFFETDPLPPHLVLPLRFDNLMRGDTYGLEATANLKLTNRWKLSGAYSLLRMQLRPYSTSRDTNAELAEGDSPRHQLQFHSLLSLPRSLEADAAIYHVSSLPNQRAPRYTRVDGRFGWRPMERLELSLGLQNLLDNRHVEFAGLDASVATNQISRSVYGKMTWRF